MKPAPSLLQPMFIPRIWGARSLAPLYPEKENLAEPIGEAWLTGHSCTFANGPFAGQALGAAWPAMPAEWRGTKFREAGDFPLLVKFIFPADKLSIQVHPDDVYAKAHETAAGGRGKTEMWYAISAQPGAEVLLGFKPGVNAKSFRAAIAEGTLETTLERAPVRSGDIFFVPAGTPHTIGPGMVLCEVQQYSDLTYRIFDYNRLEATGKPRELHIEKALEVMRFSGQSGGKVQPISTNDGAATKTYLVACPYFATEKWEFSQRFKPKTNHEHFDLLVVLEGEGNIHWESGAARYHNSETWLIPAGLAAYELIPSGATKLLRTYVPHLYEFAHEMASHGIDESARSRLIFSN